MPHECLGIQCIRLEAIALRLEVIALRLEVIASIGWRPSLL